MFLKSMLKILRGRQMKYIQKGIGTGWNSGHIKFEFSTLNNIISSHINVKGKLN